MTTPKKTGTHRGAAKKAAAKTAAARPAARKSAAPTGSAKKSVAKKTTAKKAPAKKAAASKRRGQQAGRSADARSTRAQSAEYGGKGGGCESLNNRVTIDRIVLYYTTNAGHFEVEFDNSMQLIVTDHSLAQRVKAALHLKTRCSKPPGTKGPKKLSAGGAGTGEDPECCYYINGEWVCW